MLRKVKTDEEAVKLIAKYIPQAPMEYEQLSCHKLVGLTDVKNNLKWSSDDKIAVITRKGVHVLVG